MITQEQLKEVLNYDPETGLFTWIKKRGHKKNTAGGKRLGYISIGVGFRLYQAHRLAWLYMTGEWPKFLDHIDGDRSNNRFSNLRIATASQNAANAKRSATNTSGFKGVTWHKGAKKWMAQIVVREERKYLGLFDRVEDAHQAYVSAAREGFGEFARAE